MVFGGFERVIEACSQLNFPALRLAVKLNLRYPVWFDETFPQDVLQKGITPAGQVAQFCELWKSRDNYCIPLVLEVARRDGPTLEEFVQVAENALVVVFKTANYDPNEWEAMEILFEQYIENLCSRGFLEDHDAFLYKMSQPLSGAVITNKEDEEIFRMRADRRLKAIEKSIEENYYPLLKTLMFKGEVASRLVTYRVITMEEKQQIEIASATPEGHARILVLNYIRKRPEMWNAFLAALRETYSSEPLASALNSSYNRFMELLAYE